MRNMLGFDNKATKSRNQHFVETSYYDRLIFYQYLTQSRIRHNHNFSNWGTVNTCAIYARSNGSRQHSHSSSFFGHTTTLSTFMKETKQLRNDFDSKIHQRLIEEDKIVCCLDNNQKGNPLKYQRYGKSNKFVKVTGSVIINYKYADNHLESIKEKVELS